MIFLSMIVRETNIYADKLFHGSGVKGKFRITSWKNTNIEEFKVFLGLLLHMGTIQLP